MDRKDLEFTAGHATGWLDMAETLLGFIVQFEGCPAEKVLTLVKEFCIKEIKESVFPYDSKHVKE